MLSCCSLVLFYCSPFSDLSLIRNSRILVMFSFGLSCFLCSITILLSFLFVDTFIPMDTYTNKSCMIGPVRISTIVHPSAQTSSLLRLLRLLRYTPECLRKLCELRYPEIWDNVIVRGCNTYVEAKSLPSTPVLQTSPCSALPLNTMPLSASLTPTTITVHGEKNM